MRYGIAITLGILFVIFGRPLSGLYTNDATCITLCIQILWIVAFIQPFQSSQFIVAGALRGAGDTKFVAKLTFFTVMLLRPGLALLAINVFSPWTSRCLVCYPDRSDHPFCPDCMALSVWQVEGIRAAYKSCCLTPVRNPVVYAKHLRNFKHFFYYKLTHL